MEKKRVVEVLVVLTVLIVGFLIVFQQRQTKEAEIPLPKQESTSEKALDDLGANPSQKDLTSTKEDGLLEDLGESPNRRELSEEEKQELLDALGTPGAKNLA